MAFVLDRKTFIYALTHFPCFSCGGLSNVVYELLQDCFVHDDLVSGFDFFF
jgi:hypothetical protein